MLTINLFDENYRQSSCSVAHQQSREVRYVRDRREWDGITMFTDGYVIDGTVTEVQSKYKVGWLHEPYCLWSKHYQQAPAYADDFDVVLTYYMPLLRMRGFAFVPYGGVWISEDEWGLREKSQLVSMLYGSKMSAPGHRMRHVIADTLGDHGPTDFFGFKGTPTNYGAETKLLVHRDYMFSIVCETAEEDNLFTEILLDCFAVGTIPVFWGAPNIGAFFDDRGILQFSGAEEAAYIVDALTPALYRELLPYVKTNLWNARDYRVTEDWMVENGLFKEMV